MQPVVRALAVLRLLAPNRDGLTLAEIADRLGVPVGSMHRILAVLEGERFITRSPSNRRYFLGPAARRLSDETGQGDAVVAAPHRALAAAAAGSGETVFLTEVVGDRAVCVSLVESDHPLRMYVRIGQDMPLHAAAAARTLLAYMSEREARQLLGARPLPGYTEDTMTDVDAVVAHLSVVRARGYDVCDDELEPGVWAVSMPVRTRTGRVTASVTLAAPAYRVPGEGERSRLHGHVREAALAMSADLGWADGAAVS